MGNPVSQKKINNIVLILLIAAISILFLVMIQQYLMPIFLAGLFTALVAPLHLKLLNRMGGRDSLTSLLTILLLLGLVLFPLGLLGGIVVGQAIDVGQSVSPWVQKFIDEPSVINPWLERLPYFEEVAAYKDQIITKLGKVIGEVSQLLVGGLTKLTRSALEFVFLTFIMLYVMFFFLTDGRKFLGKILYYLPLKDEDEQLLLARFTSVGKATIKGTMVIGMIQGAVCGVGFALAGLDNPVFWGTLMAVASIIPLVGTALIWGPATVILALSGDWAGVGILLVICGLIAANLDNLIRPWLVGKDTQMHDILILVSTLGGISMFGIIGIVIGPIIAALFVTLWEIYGVVFQDYLPEAGIISSVEKDEK